MECRSSYLPTGCHECDDPEPHHRRRNKNYKYYKSLKVFLRGLCYMDKATCTLFKQVRIILHETVSGL